MVEYEDFALKIEPSRGDVHPVIVLQSPAGEGRSVCRLPFGPDEIERIVRGLAQGARGRDLAVVEEAGPAAPALDSQEIGARLFAAIFSGPIGSLFDESLGRVHAGQRGLRIKLHIDPEELSLARLAGLPWELLYRAETRDFLSLSRFTPVVRTLDVRRSRDPLPLAPPLRILVVVSSPADYPRLDLAQERRQIEASWAGQPDVEVEFLEEATVQALHGRLSDRPYHVLHYMGHGGFDERTGRGALLMEDRQGRGVTVTGSTMDVLLSDASSVRLVFLNACETARMSRQQGMDPFAGVASALVMAGIPAVVAMQAPISNGAATDFASEMYRHLATGRPVDSAVAEGRQAVYLAQPGTPEWALPVLFMQAPQGVLFERTASRPAARPAADLRDRVTGASAELDQHLHNLQRLREQRAIYAAGEEPIRLLNQIEAEERAIAEIRSRLQG